MEDKNWILSQLIITQDWQKPGFYKGTIQFKNNIKMEITMFLDTEKCARIMAIISDEIVDSAKVVSESLIKSMPTQLPSTPNGIEDAKTE